MRFKITNHVILSTFNIHQFSSVAMYELIITYEDSAFSIKSRNIYINTETNEMRPHQSITQKMYEAIVMFHDSNENLFYTSAPVLHDFTLSSVSASTHVNYLLTFNTIRTKICRIETDRDNSSQAII